MISIEYGIKLCIKKFKNLIINEVKELNGVINLIKPLHSHSFSSTEKRLKGKILSWGGGRGGRKTKTVLTQKWKTKKIIIKGLEA